MSRIAFQDDDTRMLLWMYFGLVQGRSVKKNDLHGELVRRGVSAELAGVALRDVLTVIGMAADNRIPEIDDVNEAEKDSQ